MTDLDLNELVLTWVTTYGSPMVAGILLLGALGATDILPFPQEDILTMIRTKTNPKFLEANLAAFRMGQEAAADPQNWPKPISS